MINALKNPRDRQTPARHRWLGFSLNIQQLFQSLRAKLRQRPRQVQTETAMTAVFLKETGFLAVLGHDMCLITL